MPHQWTEVNLIPLAPRHPLDLALELVKPLIHETLIGHWEAWFYSVYTDPSPDHLDHLRLRLLWKNTERGTARTKMVNLLDTVKGEGRLANWYEGSHGKEGEIYPGEADKFGPEMWEVTYKNWMSGCEMALKIRALIAQGTRLTMSPEDHWAYRIHMFSNPLGLSYIGEAQLSLLRALGYLAGQPDDRSNKLVKAIEDYLKSEPPSGL